MCVNVSSVGWKHRADRPEVADIVIHHIGFGRAFATFTRFSTRGHMHILIFVELHLATACWTNESSAYLYSIYTLTILDILTQSPIQLSVIFYLLKQRDKKYPGRWKQSCRVCALKMVDRLMWAKKCLLRTYLCSEVFALPLKQQEFRRSASPQRRSKLAHSWSAEHRNPEKLFFWNYNRLRLSAVLPFCFWLPARDSGVLNYDLDSNWPAAVRRSTITSSFSIWANKPHPWIEHIILQFDNIDLMLLWDLWIVNHYRYVNFRQDIWRCFQQIFCRLVSNMVFTKIGFSFANQNIMFGLWFRKFIHAFKETESIPRLCERNVRLSLTPSHTIVHIRLHSTIYALPAILRARRQWINKYTAVCIFHAWRVGAVSIRIHFASKCCPEKQELMWTWLQCDSKYFIAAQKMFRFFFLLISLFMLSICSI